MSSSLYDLVVFCFYKHFSLSITFGDFLLQMIIFWLWLMWLLQTLLHPVIRRMMCSGGIKEMLYMTLCIWWITVLQGLVYTITDVEEVHEWMVTHFTEHPLFERVSKETLADDIIIDKLGTSTEEGKKVQRNKGQNFLAVFRRVENSTSRSQDS